MHAVYVPEKGTPTALAPATSVIVIVKFLLLFGHSSQLYILIRVNIDVNKHVDELS